MSFKAFISSRFLALAIGLQVFNISMNQNDYLLGKTGNGVVYINEIETVVEFIAEFCITGQDVIPESQVPGGSLGFEEEEKHIEDKKIAIIPSYVPEQVQDELGAYYNFNIKDFKLEVTTPPPRA